MSHREKLEQVLELLINEETDAASELLHTVIVEKARTMYEDLVDEDFGGDEKEDFADEISADKEEIETDEIFDNDEEGKEGEELEDEPASEEEVEDRLEDVEAQLAELTVQFDQIMQGDEVGDEEFAGDEVEGGEEGFGDVEVDAVDDMEYADEGMYEEVIDELDEATKLQDECPDTGQKEEGKFAGTGKNSKIGKTGKESMFTKAPSKADHGGKPHETGKGGDESTVKVGEGEDNTPTSNIDVKTGEKKSADVSSKDDKSAKSPLGSPGSPKGN